MNPTCLIYLCNPSILHSARHIVGIQEIIAKFSSSSSLLQSSLSSNNSACLLGSRHYSKHLICIVTCHPQNSLMWKMHYYLLFKDEKSKAEVSPVTFLSSHLRFSLLPSTIYRACVSRYRFRYEDKERIRQSKVPALMELMESL